VAASSYGHTPPRSPTPVRASEAAGKRPGQQLPASLVIVPVTFVRSVPVAVVHVVGVVAVRHRDVAALGPVLVVVTLVSRVLATDLALVHVVAVDAMDVAVVRVVSVVAVRHRDVTAALPVGVLVASVRGVLNRTGHAGNPPVTMRRGVPRTANRSRPRGQEPRRRLLSGNSAGNSKCRSFQQISLKTQALRTGRRCTWPKLGESASHAAHWTT
jgi:hypothetical protein